MTSRRSDEKRDVAVKEYVAGLTMLEVARLLNVSESSVSAWVREAGVVRPKGSTHARRAANTKRTESLADLATSGDSLSVVAHRHRVATSTLATWREVERDLAYTGGWFQDGLIQRGTAREAS